MAAECEIDDCGVLAIGRCLRCGRAMCTSHRALTLQGGPVTDQCTQCQAAVAKEGRDRAQREALEAEVARRARQDKQQDEMRTAKRAILGLLRQLAATGIQPTEEFDRVTTRVTTGWLKLREEWRVIPESRRYGWFVGSYSWEYQDTPGDRPLTTYTSNFRTYVTLDGQLATEDHPTGIGDTRLSVSIDPDQEPRATHSVDWGQVLASLTAVAQKLGAHVAEER